MLKHLELTWPLESLTPENRHLSGTRDLEALRARLKSPAVVFQRLRAGHARYPGKALNGAVRVPCSHV